MFCLALSIMNWCVTDFLIFIYRSVNLIEALKYSKVALEYESQLEDRGDLTSVNNSAGTILNICAILSKLDR
mgnify:CR=1 FL=1